MAVCGSVLVVAGLVAALAGAVATDRATVRPATETVATPTAPPPADAAPSGAAGVEPGRVTDPGSATSLAAADWRAAPTQDVLEVPPGRFDTILTRGEGAVVLIGRADPARVPPATAAAPADRPALEAEARRLADAYAEILGPEADGVATVSEDDRAIAGLPTHTSVRRLEGGDVDGALVRVSTVAAFGRTVALLAVARPGPTLDADAADADTVVRSLRVDPAPVN